MFDDLPTKNGYIFHSKLLNCQGVKQKQLGQSMDFVGVVVKCLEE